VDREHLHPVTILRMRMPEVADGVQETVADGMPPLGGSVGDVARSDKRSEGLPIRRPNGG